jgi:hypothetical protein
LLFGVLDQHAAFLSSGPAGVHVDDEDLTRELIRALVAYLGVRAEHSAHAT